VMNPFFRLGRLDNELNRFFRWDTDFFGRRDCSAPAVNVFEEPDSWIFTFEVPGIEPEEIDLSIRDGVLTLKGKKTAVDLPEGTRLHRNEFSQVECEFSRSLTVPDNIDEEKIEAETKNGLLTVTLTKSANKKEKKIQILPRLDERN